jgi:endonuclease/exonuclease/phosphatase family metal-dependent hydrolase
LTLRLLSYNVRFGGRGREARIAEVIRAAAPDLVVFQEATDTRVVEHLARETGMPVWAARRGHSLAYISRAEVAHHEWYHPRGSKHSFLEVVLAGSEARVFGLHLRAMHSKWTERQRAREIRALLEGIEQHQHGFHVLVGDFNTLAPGELLETQRMPRWIRALVWLSGRDIQRETIQVVLDAGYTDAYRAHHPLERGSTFPTWDPHIRFDYVFAPKAFAERVTACEVVTEPAGVADASDHFPLLAHLDTG